MKPELSAALGEAVQTILDTMFYTGCWEAAAQPSDAVCARIHFHGEPSGEFEMFLERGAARKLAAAYLGLEESDLPEPAEEEVACELANMICGATLSRLHPDSVVRLESPELVAPRPEGERRHFETPEGLLSVSMRVN